MAEFRLLLVCGLLMASSWSTPLWALSLTALRASVFKIQVMSDEPSLTEPWKRMLSSQGSGTGFYIGDGRILTNAHVVANASFITVQRDGDSTPMPAVIRHIAHDADLAILEPQDEVGKKALAELSALTFGALPRLRTPVSTIGFPLGGEQLSVTDGVVSRVSYRRYVHHGSAQHLLVQVDSAINPGNSGGPVVQGNQVVGVAFQSYAQAENTGYIIPTPVISRFLRDIEDGHYQGHPDDGLTVTDWAILNPSTAAFYRLKQGDGGVKIAHVDLWAPTAGLLQFGDIILAIDGQSVGVDGKVNFNGERVDFRVIFDLKLMGDQCRFTVLRDGIRRDVTVAVLPAREHHVTGNIYARHPRYFVYGGLVFTVLSRNLMRTWGDKWYRDAPLALRYLDSFASYDPEYANNQDIIVLVKRLPDAVNAYATGNMFRVVKAVDGKRVGSISDLISALEGGASEYAVIGFMGSQDPLVLSRPQVKARNNLITKKYGVAPDRWLPAADEQPLVPVKERS